MIIQSEDMQETVIDLGMTWHQLARTWNIYLDIHIAVQAMERYNIEKVCELCH